MSTSADPVTEVALRLRLTAQARQKLAERAAQHGQNLEEYTSELIEQTVTKPNVDELLAPFRKEVDQSGMTDEQLDAMHEELHQRVWQDKQARKP